MKNDNTSEHKLMRRRYGDPASCFFYMKKYTHRRTHLGNGSVQHILLVNCVKNDNTSENKLMHDRDARSFLQLNIVVFMKFFYETKSFF